MARKAAIRLLVSSVRVSNGVVNYRNCDGRSDPIPQLFWQDGSPWSEANLWLYSQRIENLEPSRTTDSRADSLLTYARFLEASHPAMSWKCFPKKGSRRCINLFRGYLMSRVRDGSFASTTASTKMHHILNMYRWMVSNGIFSPRLPFEIATSRAITFTTSTGLIRRQQVISSNLSISTRKTHNEAPENGLMPVSDEVREQILTIARDQTPIELYLMLALGFFTGMRIGTIGDLKIRTLENAIPDPMMGGHHLLTVGPNCSIPVQTKFSVTGNVIIPDALLSFLREYAFSVRRTKREYRVRDQALLELLFITKNGMSYVRRTTDRSPAVNTLMHRLRSHIKKDNVHATDFKFHQTRATFATNLADYALQTNNDENAVALVSRLLLQRDESSAFRYIRFVKESRAKARASEAFSRALLRT